MLTPILALLFLAPGPARAEPVDPVEPAASAEGCPDDAPEGGGEGEGAGVDCGAPFFAPSETEVDPDAEARLEALVARLRAASALSEIADALTRSGDTLAAADAYEALFRASPEAPSAEPALRAAVELHASSGRLRRALDLRGLWLERFPDGLGRGDALAAQARDYAQAARWSESASGYEQLAEERPDHPRAPDALWRAAEIREAMGQIEQAAADLERWLARYGDRPERPWIAAEYGRLLEERGDWASAEAHWRGLYTDLEVWGGEALRARLRCAAALQARGRGEEARALIRESADWFRDEGAGSFGVDPSDAAELLALEVRLALEHLLGEELPADASALSAWLEDRQRRLEEAAARAEAIRAVRAGPEAVQALVDVGDGWSDQASRIASLSSAAMFRALQLATEDRAAEAWAAAIALDHEAMIFAAAAEIAWERLGAARPLEASPLIEALPEPDALDGAGSMLAAGALTVEDPDAWASVESQLRERLIDQPADLAAHQTLALSLLAQGAPALAELTARAALDRFAHTAPTWNAVGVARWRQGRPDAAAAAFRQALALDPGYPPAAINLGGIALRARDYAAAEALLTTALGRARGDADALRGLAVAFRGLGDAAEPPEIYRYLTRTYPWSDVDALNASLFYGEILGDFRRARRILRRFARKNRGEIPADHDVLVRLLRLEQIEADWLARRAELDALRAEQDASLAQLGARLARYEARLAAVDCAWSEATGKLAALQNVAEQARDVLERRAWTRVLDLIIFMDAMDPAFEELEAMCGEAPAP